MTNRSQLAASSARNRELLRLGLRGALSAGLEQNWQAGCPSYDSYFRNFRSWLKVIDVRTEVEGRLPNGSSSDLRA